MVESEAFLVHGLLEITLDERRQVQVRWGLGLLEYVQLQG